MEKNRNDLRWFQVAKRKLERRTIDKPQASNLKLEEVNVCDRLIIVELIHICICGEYLEAL